MEADLAFHLLLCQLADNPMLVESWRHLEGRIRVALMSHDAAQLPGTMSRDRRAPIVDAIEQGDPASALRIVEEHMAAAADLVRRRLTSPTCQSTSPAAATTASPTGVRR